MRSAFAAVLLALALAGCMGGEGGGAATTASREGIAPAVIVDPRELAGDVAAGSADAPLWNVGDAWDVTIIDSTEERASLVVTAASGDSYTIATTSESMTVFDAMLDVSYLGRIRASDLAGYQQDQPVLYFSFPLEDGKTWTTRWDGMDITLTATKSARGFDIVGLTPQGAEHVRYDFVPDLKWWSHMEFAAGYGFHVARHVNGWTGEVYQATSNLVFEMGSSAPVLSAAAGSFTISEGQTLAMVVLEGGGAEWARAFTLVQPDGTPYLTTSPNAEGSAEAGGYFVTERLPPTPGTWRIAAPSAHDAEGWGSARVFEIALAEIAVL